MTRARVNQLSVAVRPVDIRPGSLLLNQACRTNPRAYERGVHVAAHRYVAFGAVIWPTT